MQLVMVLFSEILLSVIYFNPHYCEILHTHKALNVYTMYLQIFPLFICDCACRWMTGRVQRRRR